MRVLFIGDIVGKKARIFSCQIIKEYKKLKKVDIVIVNVENSAGGFGVTPDICEDFFFAGADVLTTGNHVWDKKEIIPYIKKTEKVLRPLNMVEGTPGIGLTRISTEFGCIGVANIMTNLFMPASNPMFDYLPQLMEKLKLDKDLNFSLVDVHGEATSEKMALGYALDGHVSAVVGTHTHVPTSDYRVLENGTAYISDVGMSGDYNSIIGMEKKISMNRFLNLNTKNSRLEVSKGEPTLCGVLITTHDNGYAKSIKPLRVGGILDKNKFSKE